MDSQRGSGVVRVAGDSGLVHLTLSNHHAYSPASPADAFDRTVEHVIKLVDTALDAYSWTGDALALAAIEVRNKNGAELVAVCTNHAKKGVPGVLVRPPRSATRWMEPDDLGRDARAR